MSFLFLVYNQGRCFGDKGIKREIFMKAKKKKVSIFKLLLFSLILMVLVALIYYWPRVLRIKELYNDACAIANKSELSDFNGSQTTIIYDKDGKELGSMRDTKDMYYVKYDDIP